MSIKDVLDEYRVSYREHGDHPHVTEGWIGTQCAFCSPNGNYRLGFNLRNGVAVCWSCGKVPAGEAMAMLIGKPVNVGWALVLKNRDGQFFEKKARGTLRLPTGCGELLKPHRRYLEGRNFDPDELVEVWEIMGTGAVSSRPWSLIIPIRYQYETLSYTTRQLHDKGTRYCSARPEHEAVSVKELLCGEDMAVNAVAVCEGFFDAARIGPGAVATMGLSVSDAQVRRMGRFLRRLIIFDSTPDAQRRAMVLCRRLESYEGETVNVELSGKDAAVSPEHEIEEVRKMLR